MITLIEALNFRCFKYIRQPLGPFHVLVGPNASGKSTFLDILLFLREFVSEGLEIAVKKRSYNFYDLVYGREGNSFELALEIKIPESIRSIECHDLDILRYELRILMNSNSNLIEIDRENIYLLSSYMVSNDVLGNSIVRDDRPATYSYTRRNTIRGIDSVSLPLVTMKKVTKNDSAMFPASRTRHSIFQLISTYDEDDKIILWFHDFLIRSNKISFVSEKLTSAAAPETSTLLLHDGSNLPWVVEDFQKSHSALYKDWIHHLQTALPDLVSIRSVLRPEDHTRYIMLKYSNGIEIPSWCISEGTLRLIALTLIVYLPDNNYIYLIEEPENGIHPQAVETIMQSLQSVYDGQVFITTHSPLILNMVNLDQILCFTKDENGVHIVNGKDHPVLKEWRNEVSLGTLFASGVMG